MDDYYRELGTRVRDARGQRSQSDLAARSGVNRASIANVELGRNRVTVDLLDRLARALEVDPCALLPTRLTTAGNGPDERLRPRDRRAVDRVRVRAGLDPLSDDAAS